MDGEIKREKVFGGLHAVRLGWAGQSQRGLLLADAVIGQCSKPPLIYPAA